MRILGLSAFYHDSAAAMVVDGRLVAAAQEERFTRVKHDASFPEQAIRYCLHEIGSDLDGVDYVVFYEKPLLTFERLLETYLALSPRGLRSFRSAMAVWLKDKLFQKEELRRALGKLDGRRSWQGPLLFTEHHQSHAASAFFPSPFPRAAILTMDGVGEWCTTSLGHGLGARVEILKEIHFPHSLGLLYSAFTYYTGFRVNSGEYKLMGLAPYGEPRFVNEILGRLIDLKSDGSFWLDQSYFDYATGLHMTSPKFDELFGGAPRQPDAPLTQREMDLAASVQHVTEEVVLRLARTARRETGEKKLCLAGGVALNCVANGKLLHSGIFDDIWIQPAAGDAGGAVGAALSVWHQYLGNDRLAENAKLDGMAGGYLGPSFTTKQASEALTQVGARFEVLEERQVIARTAESLSRGRAAGWMQGRMEFGPRALGNRSILGDARSPSMQKILNLKVKYRESFRPFAPAILREDLADWFKLDTDSPYMLLVADVAPKRRRGMSQAERALFGIDKLNICRSEIPAVTHVDYSARVQTVHRETNPCFQNLLTAFKQRTGCPVLVNTSFNVRGEPIVCTPQDAFRCFMGTDLDDLVIENCVLRKEEQQQTLQRDYREQFALD